MSRVSVKPMQDSCSGNKAKIGIGGIKVSPELAQFNLVRSASEGGARPSLLQCIAEEGINMTCLTWRKIESDTLCCFCVARSDAERVKHLMGLAISHGDQIQIIESVASVSIFPHQYSFAVLGAAVRILGKSLIPVHSLCTSLSSITVTIDYGFVDRLVSEFRKVFDLPCNHAPFHQDFDLKPYNR